MALCVLLLAQPGLAQATAPAQEASANIRLGQPATEYQARRKALMEAIQERNPGISRRDDAGAATSLVVVRGSSTGDREDFEEGRFRQNNGFAYLTGIDVPGSYLVLWPAEERDVLYVPAGQRGNRMNGGLTAPEPGEHSARTLGFAEVAPTSRLLGDLFQGMSDPLRTAAFGGRRGLCTVYTFSPNPRPGDHSAEARFVRFLKEGAPSTEFRDLAPLVAELRLIKSQAEIGLLQRAIDITCRAQRDVARALRPGLFEYQLEAKLMHAFLDGGALRPGFASIVGSGPNACIPHYFDNDRKIDDGDLVVVDIGAEFQYYTADITRTYPASGVFTPRQREIYQLVLDAQTHAAGRFEPGKTRLSEMTGWVRDFFRKSPLRAQDESGQQRTLDHFFIHGLGHFLGMDVHDVGDWSKPMQPGVVFTIEPGLYISSENIGIRIEDDYLVTEHGLETLSGLLPSEPDELESLMSVTSKPEPTETHVGSAR